MSGSDPSAEAELPRLYSDLAWLWPILSPPEHYEDEAETLRQLYAELGRPRSPLPRLLDLGAGGGHVLAQLSGDFDCTASDLSPAMLELCARLVPGARRVVGDMRTLRLGELFDAVLIQDAVDYMRTAADVRSALATCSHWTVPTSPISPSVSKKMPVGLMSPRRGVSSASTPSTATQKRPTTRGLRRDSGS